MKKTAFLVLIGALCVTASALPVLAQQPVLTVYANPGFGSWIFDQATPVPVTITYYTDNELGIGFSWQGDASAYGGTLVGYRLGWDLVDPNDPNDPGWNNADFGPWLFTAQKVFTSGVHSFTVGVKDTAGTTTWASFLIDVQAPVVNESMVWGSIKSVYR